MEVINIKGNFKYPNVILDKQNGIFKISGKSLPEDARKFYDPIIQWLTLYVKDPNPSTKFEFHLDYINTASSMMLLAIFLQLKLIIPMNSKEVAIYWHFDEHDMQETGENYEEATGLTFHHIDEIEEDEF